MFKIKVYFDFETLSEVFFASKSRTPDGDILRNHMKSGLSTVFKRKYRSNSFYNWF